MIREWLEIIRYSSKFTVLLIIIVAFTKKKENRHISKEDRAASRANTQPSNEYFSIRTRFILILWFVYMLSYGESKSATTSYMLLDMNTMSTTSNSGYK